ncbi:MAG: isoamylase early set domain-containing protein [Candidatus Delongbacteria bacterium]|nr:isoamylase early set domain-containing protein [Candidatus Delongbacteria bacterium]
MSTQKVFHKKKPVCKVTFKLNKEVANSAMQVNLVGDFNNWDKENLQMKKIKTGGFSIAVNLDIGKEYEFKYFIDNSI